MNTPDASISSDQHVRVLLADDHQLVRQGLAGLLGMHPDIEVVGEASNGRMAVEMAENLRPDAVVMDVNMPGLNGVEATGEIARRLPQVKVIGLSLHEEDDIGRALLEAGAVAYVAKDGAAEDLVAAILALRRPADS